MQDPDLSAQPTEVFAFLKPRAFHIPLTRAQHLQRATENALATRQKLAAHLKTEIHSVTHEPLLAQICYETPLLQFSVSIR